MRRLGLVLSAALLAGVTLVLQSPPAAAATATYLTGTGDGAGYRVRTFDASGAPISDQIATPAPGSSPSGVRVAVGDVNNDGTDDIITASGPGTPSFVSVSPGTGQFPFAGFSPYGEFGGGVNVAAGDVDGDGRDEIVTAADSGGGPHVRVWDVDGRFQITEKIGWFAYDAAFRGGVNVAVAHVTGSSRADVITGAGPGGGPHVKVFDISSGSPVSTAGWFAYSPAFGGGVQVAAGSVDGNTGVITGAGAGGGPHVRVFTPLGGDRGGFYAYAAAFGGGVNVAVGDADLDGRGEIVTAPASGGGPHVRTFGANGALSGAEFFAYDPGMTAGVHIAVFRRGPSNTSTGGNS